MTTNLPWKASLPFAVFFFSQGPTEERWKLLRERHSAPFSKILQRYIKEVKLTALLVLPLSRKPSLVCYCFREPIKTFFPDACQMIVKSRVLHLFPVLQTGRSHIINILLTAFFSVRSVNCGSSFLLNSVHRRTRPCHDHWMLWGWHYNSYRGLVYACLLYRYLPAYL